MLKQLSLELKMSTVVSLPNMKYEVQRCMKKIQGVGFNISVCIADCQDM